MYRPPGHVRGQVLPDWSGQLDQESLAGSLEPLQVVAHLGHLRQLGQGVLPEVCQWARLAVAPGRGDQG